MHTYKIHSSTHNSYNLHVVARYSCLYKCMYSIFPGGSALARANWVSIKEIKWKRKQRAKARRESFDKTYARLNWLKMLCSHWFHIYIQIGRLTDKQGIITCLWLLCICKRWSERTKKWVCVWEPMMFTNGQWMKMMIIFDSFAQLMNSHTLTKPPNETNVNNLCTS